MDSNSYTRDCIPLADFVARHCALAAAGRFLSGNCILLIEAFTRETLARHLPLHAWGPARWLDARARGHINRWLPLLRLPDAAWRNTAPQCWEGVKTCHLSAWQTDLVRVHGFDESYSGWGWRIPIWSSACRMPACSTTARDSRHLCFICGIVKMIAANWMKIGDVWTPCSHRTGQKPGSAWISIN